MLTGMRTNARAASMTRGLALPPSTPLVRPGAKSSAAAAILVTVGFFAVVLLAAWFDTLPVLMALVGLAAVAIMVIRPEIATFVVVFLLYSNVPAVAFKLYSLPQVIAGSFILLLGLPLLHQVVGGRQPLRVDGTLRLMLAFLAVMLAASVWANDTGLALDRVGKFAVEGLLLYWLLINTLRSAAAVRQAMVAALAAGVLLASLTIYQSVTGSYEQEFGGLAERQLAYEYKREAAALRGEVYRFHRADRAGGPQLGPNRYGQIMIVLLPLAAVLYRRGATKRARLMAAAAGIVILIGGVLLTYSRATMLALALLVLAAALVKWLRARTVCAVAVCGVLLMPVAAPGLYQRLSTLQAVTDLDDPSEADGALRGRATEMLAALRAFIDHPILGVGPGQYTPFYSTEYQQIADIKFRELQESRRAHTLYFEMAAEVGLVGLTIFLVIPLVLLRALWRARRVWAAQRPDLADLATALCLSLLAFLLTACFLSHAFERYYWFLIALAAAALETMRVRPPLSRGLTSRVVPARSTRAWPAVRS